MPCYKPLYGLYYGATNPETGKKTIRIVKRDDPFFGDKLRNYKPGDKIGELEVSLIPCGKCIGCRLDYSRSWADRMMLELETAGKGIFVTLTYNDDNMPPNKDVCIGCKDKKSCNLNRGTLCKRECQLWMKRLRKKYSDHRIRFFLAGEYGSKSFRCHYHCILFGIGLEDLEDLKLYKGTSLGYNLYTSKSMSDIWDNKGYVVLAPVTWKTCAYVARYVTKKITGKDAEIYKTLRVKPEFSLMSRKPGIGREYLEQHPDILDFQSINISTPEGGLKIRIPKYYLKQLEKSDPIRYEEMKRERKKFADDQMLLKLKNTDLDFQEYLDMLEVKKSKQANTLLRCEI